MPSRHPEADLGKLKRLSIEERGGTVRVEDFVAAYDPGPEVDVLLSVVPDLFSGSDLRAAVQAVASASKAGRPVLVMYGGHVVKCGLSRLLIDLMERRIITALATNGAGAIHDFEIAMWGRTSEDVATRLADGSFGMCRETADHMNDAARTGHQERLGLGEALGGKLVELEAPHSDASILRRAYELGIPHTVHVAIGTDVVHQHASADGAAIGDTSLRDFRILAEVVGGLEGGAVVNIGSAVVLPEVFLKALSVARNLGNHTASFAAIGMDMNEPYRAMVNVVGRPTAQSGLGVALKGRHELIVPLFWVALRRSLATG
jgi:deoxyhypusine synthase